MPWPKSKEALQKEIAVLNKMLDKAEKDAKLTITLSKDEKKLWDNWALVLGEFKFLDEQLQKYKSWASATPIRELVANVMADYRNIIVIRQTIIKLQKTSEERAETLKLDAHKVGVGQDGFSLAKLIATTRKQLGNLNTSLFQRVKYYLDWDLALLVHEIHRVVAITKEEATAVLHVEELTDAAIASFTKFLNYSRKDAWNARHLVKPMEQNIEKLEEFKKMVKRILGEEQLKEYLEQI